MVASKRLSSASVKPLFLRCWLIILLCACGQVGPRDASQALRDSLLVDIGRRSIPVTEVIGRLGKPHEVCEYYLLDTSIEQLEIPDLLPDLQSQPQLARIKITITNRNHAGATAVPVDDLSARIAEARGIKLLTLEAGKLTNEINLRLTAIVRNRFGATHYATRDTNLGSLSLLVIDNFYFLDGTHNRNNSFVIECSAQGMVNRGYYRRD
jgi:hypothetical protein